MLTVSRCESKNQICQKHESSPQNASNAVHGTKIASINGPLRQRDTECDGDEAASENPSSAYAGNCASHDKSGRSRCNGAQQTSELEYSDRHNVRRLKVIESV